MTEDRPQDPSETYRTGAGLPRAWLSDRTPGSPSVTSIAFGLLVPVVLCCLVILIAVATSPLPAVQVAVQDMVGGP